MSKNIGLIGRRNYLLKQNPRIEELKISFKIFFTNPTAVAGFVITLLYFIDIILVQFFPSFIGISDPNRYIYNFNNPVPLPPSSSHWCGTTAGGIDLCDAIIKSIRIDLIYSLFIVIVGAIIGLLLGLVSGYLGGIFDEILMRITDIFFSIPYLVLAIAILFVLGVSLENIAFSLIIVWWPLYARYARAQTLSIKQMTFIESAKASGTRDLMIMFKHIVPNVLPPIFVQISLDLGTVVGVFATLAFIGFSPTANIPELGYLTSLGLNYISIAPWSVIIPGLVITVFALAVNLMGDGLRDVIDPKRRSV
jgi:ABC-type dipeptide/oligopeptide/nickel transport systems, permease components